MIALDELEQILLDNNFSCHIHPDTPHTTLIIDNIEISEIYQNITYIDVNISINCNAFTIFINFKDDIVDILHLHIDLSMYSHSCNGKFLQMSMGDKNKFIEELHRLNTIGLNIKG